MSTLGILVILICLTFLVVVIRQVQRGHLLLKYALAWMGMAVFAIVGAIFPDAVHFVSTALGFEVTSNFIFLVALVFLLSVCLSLSMIVSAQAMKIKNLTQEHAILRNQVESKVDLR